MTSKSPKQWKAAKAIKRSNAKPVWFPPRSRVMLGRRLGSCKGSVGTAGVVRATKIWSGPAWGAAILLETANCSVQETRGPVGLSFR